MSLWLVSFFNNDTIVGIVTGVVVNGGIGIGAVALSLALLLLLLMWRWRCRCFHYQQRCHQQCYCGIDVDNADIVDIMVDGVLVVGNVIVVGTVGVINVAVVVVVVVVVHVGVLVCIIANNILVNNGGGAIASNIAIAIVICIIGNNGIGVSIAIAIVIIMHGIAIGIVIGDAVVLDKGAAIDIINDTRVGGIINDNHMVGYNNGAINNTIGIHIIIIIIIITIIFSKVHCYLQHCEQQRYTIITVIVMQYC